MNRPLDDSTMKEVDALLLEVAEAVADRTPIDWTAEQAKAPARTRFLHHLQQIAEVQAAHVRLGEPAAARGARFHWGTLGAIEKIGEGSFAEVWRAFDPALEREVALKLRRVDLGGRLDDRRWIEEARRLARVRHPNVLTVHGADVHDGRAGIWTERLVGQTLEEWIGAGGPLGPREAVAVGLDLCAALAAVHAAGLVHGDVTTRNVMRVGVSGASDGSGRIVLMDFGSAVDFETPGLLALGTPLFTAPEVLDGAPPSRASDVYSAGVVLYRLLTARYPVEAGPIARIRARLASERVALRDARPDLPPALVEAVERAAAPDPARRTPSAPDLERELAAAMAARPPRRGRTPWRAAIAVVAVAAATAAVLTARRPAPNGIAPSVAPSTVATDAPGAETTPPAAPAAPAALRVEAALYRITGDSRDALASGDMIGPGDALRLEVELSSAAHVYVLDEDETGKVFALFPLHGRGVANPLAPGRRHALPGSEAGRMLDWQVTSAGGRETILILASRDPLVAVEEAIAAVPAAGESEVQYPTLGAEALSRLRGVGGVRRSEPLRDPARGGMLRALAADLAKRPDDSIWMRVIELENPAP
jgi:tRNA A-37 threonylcarbamoyl transferase component Bud32